VYAKAKKPRFSTVFVKNTVLDESLRNRGSRDQLQKTQQAGRESEGEGEFPLPLRLFSTCFRPEWLLAARLLLLVLAGF